MSSFKPCDHSRDYSSVKITQIDWSIITPASEAAKTCCIRCIRKHIKCLERIADKPCGFLHINYRDNAKREILNRIVFSHTPMWYKFPAIIWCLKQGFMSDYIFNDYHLFSSNELIQLAQFGEYPMIHMIDMYISKNLWKEIETVRNNLPIARDEYEQENLDEYREELDELLYEHNLPIIKQNTKEALKFRLCNDVLGVVLSWL